MILHHRHQLTVLMIQEFYKMNFILIIISCAIYGYLHDTIFTQEGEVLSFLNKFRDIKILGKLLNCGICLSGWISLFWAFIYDLNGLYSFACLFITMFFTWILQMKF